MTFFFQFAELSLDGKRAKLAQYDVHVSELCLDLLHKMIVKDPDHRITWSAFFDHPVVKFNSKEYQKILEEMNKNSNKYIRKSEVLTESQQQKLNPQKIDDMFDDSKDQQEAPVESNVFNSNGEESPTEVKREDSADSANNDESNCYEDFIKSQQITCQVLEQLHKKAEFLQELVFLELHDVQQNLTCKPYKFKLELKLIIFKLVQELKEVIQTFCSNDFLCWAEDYNLPEKINDLREKQGRIRALLNE